MYGVKANFGNGPQELELYFRGGGFAGMCVCPLSAYRVQFCGLIICGGEGCYIFIYKEQVKITAVH